MIIQFTTGYAADNKDTSIVPVVRYVKSENKDLTQSSKVLEGNFITVTGTTDTYSARDLCEAPANQTEAGKFYPPGLLHTVQVDKLKPSTMYMYQVGISTSKNGSANVTVWSDTAVFKTPPKDGNLEPFNYIVYGDQGKILLNCFCIICDTLNFILKIPTNVRLIFSPFLSKIKDVLKLVVMTVINGWCL